MPTLTFSPNGMTVVPEGIDAFAQIQEKCTAIDFTHGSNDPSISPNQGANSFMTVPIIIPESFMENISEYFINNSEVTDQACSVLMNGNIAAAEKGVSFIPFQIELIHELIHVAHNAQGKNLRNFPLSINEQNKWSTYEEYVTIQSGAINETDFSQHYGAYARITRSAEASQILFEETQRNQHTSLRSLVTVPSDTTYNVTHSFKNRLQQLIKSSKQKTEPELEPELQSNYKSAL